MGANMTAFDTVDDDVWREHVDRARAAAAAGDRSELATATARLWRTSKVPVNVLMGLDHEIAEVLDDLCDEAVPPPGDATAADSLRLAAELLDAPWPTPRRIAALLLVTGGDVAHPRMVRLDDLAE